MPSQPLIQGYDVEVEGLPCHPGGDEYAATVHLQGDIAPALPYLNRVLAGARYHPAAASLTCKYEGHAAAFWPRKIAIANVEGQADAEALARALVDLVNETWARREAIEPDHSPWRRAAPLALYKLLPRTNCRQCGEPTCYLYALKLAAGERRLDGCPPLRSSQFAENRATLEQLLPE